MLLARILLLSNSVFIGYFSKITTPFEILTWTCFDEFNQLFRSVFTCRFSINPQVLVEIKDARQAKTSSTDLQTAIELITISKVT